MFLTFIYGSLRRGEFNHKRFKGFPESFKCTGFIRGAQLKSLGPYPAIVPSNNPEDIVKGELYELPEFLHNLILRMEQGAGYVYNPVSVEVEANAEELPGVTIPVEARAYFFERPEIIAQVPPVKGGDWTLREDR